MLRRDAYAALRFFRRCYFIRLLPLRHATPCYASDTLCCLRYACRCLMPRARLFRHAIPPNMAVVCHCCWSYCFHSRHCHYAIFDAAIDYASCHYFRLCCRHACRHCRHFRTPFAAIAHVLFDVTPISRLAADYAAASYYAVFLLSPPKMALFSPLLCHYATPPLRHATPRCRLAPPTPPLFLCYC